MDKGVSPKCTKHCACAYKTTPKHGVSHVAKRRPHFSSLNFSTPLSMQELRSLQTLTRKGTPVGHTNLRKSFKRQSLQHNNNFEKFANMTRKQKSMTPKTKYFALKFAVVEFRNICKKMKNEPQMHPEIAPESSKMLTESSQKRCQKISIK